MAPKLKGVVCALFSKIWTVDAMTLVHPFHMLHVLIHYIVLQSRTWFWDVCTSSVQMLSWQDLCNSIQKRWPGSAHNSLEVSWQDSWRDLRATRALPFQDLYARSDWPWKMSTAPQRERSDRPRVTRGRSHNSHFVWKFTGKMPDAKYTTSIEHQALTLTLRTPQCGHTVWGMKWEHFIVTLWHCFSFSRMIFLFMFPTYVDLWVFRKLTRESVLLKANHPGVWNSLASRLQTPFLTGKKEASWRDMCWLLLKRLVSVHIHDWGTPANIGWN